MMAKAFSRGYEIHEIVGKGAGSVIYRATHTKSGRTVAIKRVTEETIQQRLQDTGEYIPHRSHVPLDYTSFYDQIRTEYEVCQRMSKTPAGRYVPRVFKLIAHRKYLFLTTGYELVMDYVPGMTLREKCDYPVQELVKFYHGLARALYGMHGLGILHSDLKPQHFVVTPEKRVKLLDFGQCRKPRGSETRMQGTPDYMAPEQLKGRLVDERTDIYSLGASFYWILTGKSNRPAMAMAGADAVGSLTVGFSGRARNIREDNPEVPDALERLILDSCNPRMDERPSSMREVIERLEPMIR